MSEAQQTIAVAGGTPFAFVLAGLLAADHGYKVYLVSATPSVHGVPPPPSFSIAPVTRPETLHLASTNAAEMMRRISRIAPASIDRTDLIVRATTSGHATALSHFRHLATGFGHVVERLTDRAYTQGASVRIRDVTRLSPAPFFIAVRDWATQIGINWVDDPDIMSVRRNGSVQLGDISVDRLVLADDEAILKYYGPTLRTRIGRRVGHMAYIAEAGHGISDAEMALPSGTLLSPQRNGTLAIYADDTDGWADARAAASLPPGVRRAAMKQWSAFQSHDGAPVIGSTKTSKLYIAAGLCMLDIALAPVIARHIAGQAHGFEAEWCGMRAPTRAMSGSVVADIGPGAAA